MSGISVVRSQTQDGFLYQPPEWLLDCSFVEENASALALGALDNDEIVRINTHVSWCPNCARLVHETRKTVGYLPFLSSAASPSASAKSQLFDRIKQTQQQAPLKVETSGRSLTIPSSQSPFNFESSKAETVFVPGSNGGNRTRRFNWAVFAAPLAAVPLVVALAIVGGWALRTQEQLDDRRTQTQVLQTENADLNAKVSMLSNSLGPSSSFEFEAADSGFGGNAGGSFVPLVNDHWANLTVWNLPTTSRAYKVLVETEFGQLQQVGEFNVDETGRGQVMLELESPVDQYKSVHVQPVKLSENAIPNDSIADGDVLWTDLNSSLDSNGGGTEANANAN